MDRTLLRAAAAAAGALAVAAAFAQKPADPAKPSLRGGEASFLKKAAVDGLAEVQLGQLAKQKALRDEVKEFASRMVDDHGRADMELRQLAAAKSLALPDTLDDKHRREIDKLGKLMGPDFDRAYMKRMVEDHEHDVKDFRHMAKSAKDGEVQAFAAKTLPTLEAHLRAARATRDVTLGSKRTGNRETGSSKP